MDSSMLSCSQAGSMHTYSNVGDTQRVSLQPPCLSPSPAVLPLSYGNSLPPQSSTAGQDPTPEATVVGEVGSGTGQTCAGCGCRIEDRVMLNALDRLWHTACLKCSCCGVMLDNLGSSCFAKGNIILCRKDYIKMFGTTGTCSGCGVVIAADEMVMRCQGFVYHINCFTCAQCHSPLQPGDRYSMLNGKLFCEHEFPRLFGNPGGALPAASAGGMGPQHQHSGTGGGGNNTGGGGGGRGRQKKVDSRRYPLHVC